MTSTITPNLHGHATVIIVNGREATVHDAELSFDHIIELAYPGSQGSDSELFTITYKRGHGNKPEGTLSAGETLKIKKGMVINVVRTNKS